ncbi:hypothetical protein BDN72DRAFT_768697, partial [Pluteus cervinus]
WEKNAEVFRVLGVKESELMARSKNTEKDKALADKKIQSMVTAEADACSGVWCDEEGNRLLCAFALRVAGEDGDSPRPLARNHMCRTAPFYQGPQGRTQRDLAKAKQVYPDRLPVCQPPSFGFHWKPKSHPTLTPGRIGNVFFFPRAAYDVLEGHPAAWNRRTMTGTFPDSKSGTNSLRKMFNKIKSRFH